MLQVLGSVTIILLIGLALYLLFKKSKEKAREHLPLKCEAVQMLYSELKDPRFLILPSASSQQLSPVLMSFMDVAKLVDEKNELSRSRYDDDPILFHSPEPIIDYEQYLNTLHLPKTILDELRSFCGSFSPVKTNELSNFFLVLPANQHFSRHSSESTNYYSSSAEAFSTWLDFKENANNLCFMVQQWLEENRQQTGISQRPELSYNH